MNCIPDELRSSVSKLMHASGDNKNPVKESVEVVSGLVVQFLEALLVKAQRVAINKRNFDVECLLFACKDDKTSYKAAKTRLAVKRALDDETAYGDKVQEQPQEERVLKKSKH